MPKIMLFIDGTWLYYNTAKLSEAYGQLDFRIDFGKLPAVLAETLTKQLPAGDVDIVRTYLFGSYAANYDLRDDESVQRRRDFFEMLKEEYHYEVEVYPVNFQGRRLRKADRDPIDTFEPQEKCVDIALASSMLYMAAVPGAYDIAVAVVGDQDFIPVLQYVRRLGKRVALASIKASCSPELSDPRDEARVKDFDIIWMDELLPKLELKYEWHQYSANRPSTRASARSGPPSIRARDASSTATLAARSSSSRSRRHSGSSLPPTSKLTKARVWRPAATTLAWAGR